MVSPVLQVDLGEYRGRFREDGRWLGEGFEPASSQPAPPPGSVTRVTRLSTMSARLPMRGGVPLAAITFARRDARVHPAARRPYRTIVSIRNGDSSRS